MTSLAEQGDVVIVGGEPAALGCAARLLDQGASVIHVYPVPWGLRGASRDIGLAYPENGEPLERLVYSLGEQLASEWHEWGKLGVELLAELAAGSDGFRRGSRLLVSRSEQTARLDASDALDRQRLGDEVRLMSGGAASNYAPLATSVRQASFETHALSFAPVPVCEHLCLQLQQRSGYRAIELDGEAWSRCAVGKEMGSVTVEWGSGQATGEVAMVAAAFDSARLLGKFERALVPLLGQAFRSQPLRETTRSSVVGLTASWGYERYRFDQERRLLACGIDPGGGEYHSAPIVAEAHQQKVWQRACEIFADLAQTGQDILRWGVLFTSTCDGLPLLGPLPGEPRIQLAAGFSTSAWSRGLAAGDALARCLLEGGRGTALLRRCSPRRLV